MIRKLRLLAVLISALLLVSCARPEPEAPLPRTLPQEVTAWIEQSRSMFLAQSKVHESKQYILVTYGQKPTGGFAVEIERVVTAEGRLTVHVKFTKPAPGQIVTQALTYPYDLEVIDATNLPVEFVPSGAEAYVPTLWGIAELRPIVASSFGVKVFTPAPSSRVPRTFIFDGVANVFEGNVQYRLLDANGRELIQSFTTGAMGDWGYFKAELTVPDDIKPGAKLLLDVFTTSPKDGSIMDQIKIDLVLH